MKVQWSVWKFDLYHPEPRSLTARRLSRPLVLYFLTYDYGLSNVHTCVSADTQGSKTLHSCACGGGGGGRGQVCWLVSCSQLGHFREHCNRNKCSPASQFRQRPYTHVTIKPWFQHADDKQHKLWRSVNMLILVFCYQAINYFYYT